MHNPFNILIQEHSVISSVSTSVNELEQVLKSSPEKFEETLNLLLKFFRDYSDKYHHHKEELILFPAMNNHPDFMQQDIIHELEEHHENFREQLSEIDAALKTKEYVQALKILKVYVNDLLDHIAIENDELFIMAESLFSENEMERMYFQYKDIDNELGETAKGALEKIPALIEESVTH
jgi:hemerythrin-like domain-containing protein